MTRTGLSVRLSHRGVKSSRVGSMSKAWIVGAQLSTSHSSLDLLGVDHVLSVIERVKPALELDILIVGAREVPEIFRLVTDPHHRPTEQIFLWYNVLSDIPRDGGLGSGRQLAGAAESRLGRLGGKEDGCG